LLFSTLYEEADLLLVSQYSVKRFLTGIFLGLLVFAGQVEESRAQAPRTSFRFTFGGEKAGAGAIAVSTATLYTKQRGFGFEHGSSGDPISRSLSPLPNQVATGTRSFAFSVAVPEGNYRVTVLLGDPTEESDTTINAELRRSIVTGVRLARGQRDRFTFTVNVRNPRLAAGGEVHLKEREKTTESLAWDEKLTLEFNGNRPYVSELEIEKSLNATTVFLLGDSTVCDQPREPFCSWGQVLPCFFGPQVAIANHAESGESLRSFTSAKRLDKVVQSLNVGDYVFIQFGHNDMKSVGADEYKKELERYIGVIRKAGGMPVLVTPMHRRTFQGPFVVNSLGDFPDAVRQTAKELKVPLVDLHAASKTLYEALGPEKSRKAFVDSTHHNKYGAYELARCVVEGIRRNNLDLAKFLLKDVGHFDPAHPDALDLPGMSDKTPNDSATRDRPAPTPELNPIPE
jgi:lysophospholipase L1-like esterase